MKLFKNKKGFSLIELLIAVAILSIAIPSFFTFLNTQIYNTKLNIDMTNALFLAQKKLENLIRKGYSDSDISDTNTSNNSNLNPSIDAHSLLTNGTQYISSIFEHYDSPVTLNNTRFYICWNVAEDSSLKSTNNFKKIALIVCWVYQGKAYKVFIIDLKREE